MTVREGSRRLDVGKPIGSVRGAPSAIRKAQQYKSYNYLVNEIQQIKKKQSHYKPETKVFQNNYSGTTAVSAVTTVNFLSDISQGLLNTDRVGSSIRIKRIEIVCDARTAGGVREKDQSFILVRPHENDNPVIGDFLPGKFAMYDTTSGWEIWREHMNYFSAENLLGCHLSKSFAHGGMKIVYEQGSSNPTKNPIFWCHVNKHSVNMIYDLAVRVYYTDA